MSRGAKFSGYLLAMVVAAYSATAIAAEPVVLTGRAMGTTWTAKFVQPQTPLDAGIVTAKITSRLETLEAQFSTYRANSELSRFNASATTEWFPVSSEFAKLALEARVISELTDGAFDVTVDPLVRLWGFGPQQRRGALPSPAAIAAARTRVDWRALAVREHPPAVRRARAGITADFSSIAKGFATDALSALLIQLGAANHFVQVGGDVRANGVSAAHAGWRAGIETPADEQRTIALVVTLRGQALSTSGDYRNFFVEDGRRYGHLIDPRTGWPAGGELAAVSVVHESCATSSALATALFVLGLERGYALASERKLAAVFFVRRGDRFEQRSTPAFAAVVR